MKLIPAGVKTAYIWKMYWSAALILSQWLLVICQLFVQLRTSHQDLFAWTLDLRAYKLCSFAVEV